MEHLTKAKNVFDEKAANMHLRESLQLLTKVADELTTETFNQVAEEYDKRGFFIGTTF